MARVSVTVSQKPKPANTFKYLRRDEGRLSYTYNPAEVASTPRHASSSTEQTQGTRQSLRSAIATDMKRRKPTDPFGDVVVALPRKAPPPNASAEGGRELGEGSMHLADTLGGIGVGREPTKAKGGKSAALSSSFLKRKEQWVDINANAAGQVKSSGSTTNPSSSVVWKNGGEEEKGGSTLGITENENIEASTHPPGAAAHELVQLPLQNSYERLGGTDPAPPLSFGFVCGQPAVGGGAPYSSSIVEEPMMYGGGGLGFQFGGNRSTSVPRRLEEEYGYGNYFHRAARPHSVGSGSRSFHTSGSGSGEEKIMYQLQRELEAARYERQHFLEAKRDLEDESQRFEKFRFSAQAELDASKAQLVVEKSEARREALKELRTAEERQRTTSTMLEQERENNRRLVRENDLLQAQLSDLTTTMSESQRVQKTEISRLRRDIASLTHRNSELLAMARQQQVETLEGSSSLEESAPHTAHRNPSSGLNMKRIHDQSFHSRSNSSSGTGTGVPRRTEVPLRQRVDVLQEDTALRGEEENRGERTNGDNRVGSPRNHSQIRGGRPSPAVPTTSIPAKVSQSLGSLDSNASLGTISNEKKKNNDGEVKASIPTKEMLLGPVDPIPAVDIPNDVVVSKNELGENSNKCEVLYRSGKREVKYSNGTTKTVLPSGHTILKFVNGDIKRTFPSGRSTYWYEKAQTLHTQLPDGVELFQFLSTGQVERHLPSGEKHILYPDETYKVVRPDGTDKTVTSSGEVV